MIIQILIVQDKTKWVDLMKLKTGYIYKEAKENLGSMYGSCQKGVGEDDSV